MKKEKLSAITIFLYVISVLLLLFTLYRLYGAMTYISALVTEQDFSISENLSDVISYTYEQCASPFLFSIVLYVLGEMNEKLKRLLPSKRNDEIKLEINEQEEQTSETGCMQP